MGGSVPRTSQRATAGDFGRHPAYDWPTRDDHGRLCSARLVGARLPVNLDDDWLERDWPTRELPGIVDDLTARDWSAFGWPVSLDASLRTIGRRAGG